MNYKTLEETKLTAEQAQDKLTEIASITERDSPLIVEWIGASQWDFSDPRKYPVKIGLRRIIELAQEILAAGV